MFSRRTPVSLAASGLAELLERLRREGAIRADLAASNPTCVGIEYPPGLLDALAGPELLDYRPDPRGALAVREAVAAYYAARGCAVSPAQVFLSSSTSESYGWLFKLLADPGDEILVPRPSYPLFDCLATLEGLGVRHYRLSAEDGWGIDFDSLEAAAAPRARALVFVNPNNPTGNFLKPGERERLVEFAGRRRIALIFDEVFADYLLKEDTGAPGSMADTAEVLTFALSGLSKLAALPQMKLAWTVVSGPAAVRAQALERLEWIADAYLPVSAPVARAAPAWLAAAPAIRAPLLERLRGNLARLQAELPAASACQVLAPAGGWTAVVRVPRLRSEEEWVRLLAERHGVVVQPGYFYDFEQEAYLVVSLLARPAEFSAGVAALRACLE